MVLRINLTTTVIIVIAGIVIWDISSCWSCWTVCFISMQILLWLSLSLNLFRRLYRFLVLLSMSNSVWWLSRTLFLFVVIVFPWCHTFRLLLHLLNQHINHFLFCNTSILLLTNTALPSFAFHNRCVVMTDIGIYDFVTKCLFLWGNVWISVSMSLKGRSPTRNHILWTRTILL